VGVGCGKVFYVPCDEFYRCEPGEEKCKHTESGLKGTTQEALFPRSKCSECYFPEIEEEAKKQGIC
jgi:hypothetical protein